MAAGQTGHEQFLGIVAGQVAAKERVAAALDGMKLSVEGDLVVTGVGAIVQRAAPEIAGPPDEGLVTMRTFHL